MKTYLLPVLCLGLLVSAPACYKKKDKAEKTEKKEKKAKKKKNKNMKKHINVDDIIVYDIDEEEAPAYKF